MAHLADAKKRLRQNRKQKERNKHYRSFYRNRIKQVKAAVAEGDADKAESLLKEARSAIDRAVTKGVIHRNTASRYKSRLSRAVRNLKESSRAA
ncbi:MAG: 30S ribosomal protein S20 [bacterium]